MRKMRDAGISTMSKNGKNYHAEDTQRLWQGQGKKGKNVEKLKKWQILDGLLLREKLEVDQGRSQAKQREDTEHGDIIVISSVGRGVGDWSAMKRKWGGKIGRERRAEERRE